MMLEKIFAYVFTVLLILACCIVILGIVLLARILYNILKTSLKEIWYMFTK